MIKDIFLAAVILAGMVGAVSLMALVVSLVCGEDSL